MDFLAKLLSIGAVKDRLRNRARQLLWGAIGFVAAGIAVIAGVVFLIASGWVALRDHYDTVTADLVIGLVFLVIAVIVIMWARSMMRGNSSRTVKVQRSEDGAKVDPDVAAADLLTGENLVAATTLMLGVGYLIGNKLFSKDKKN